MELHPTEVCYNLYINNDPTHNWGVFYIGNGDVFIQGTTYIHHNENDKIKLQIMFINSWYKYNINMIVSDSYETVGKYYYDTIEDAINLTEMLKYWIKYKDFKCNKQFKKSTTFKMNEGDLLKKIQYRSPTLVDYIIYNKNLSMEDMKYVPHAYNIREKINYVYDKNIFNLEEFNWNNFNFSLEV